VHPLETFLADCHAVRTTGANAPETSFYPALSTLFNEVGRHLKPKVRCVMGLKDQGAGMPDGGLFTESQFGTRRDQMPLPGQMPERGVIERLSALGYVEGKNILIEERFADGNSERPDELARELAAIKVDVIVTPTVAASGAARRATATISIVMVHAGDPVGAGLIASLARPGGNVTGTTNLLLGGKHVELIRELVPRATKVAMLVNPSNSGARSYVADAMEAGRRFNLGIAVADVTRVEDFPNAFAKIRDRRPDGLLVMLEPLIGGQRAQVIAFAASARLPACGGNAIFVRDGGLVAYGPILAEHYVMAAGYVDKILKGAKPADLPVEQPTRFELAVNLKTAKTLSLTIPQSLIVRATDVIE
jgi:putative ABC transport system substrate-binding protein